MNSKNNTLFLAILSTILALLLLILGGYTYYNHQQQYIEEEELQEQQDEMIDELNQLVNKYDNLRALNGTMDKHLVTAKKRIASLLDTIKFTEPKLRLLLRLKTEIELLEIEKNRLAEINDSLIRDNRRKKEHIDIQKLQLTKAESYRKLLIEENKKSFTQVAQKVNLKYSKISNDAIHIKKSNGSTTNTNRSKKVDAFKTCFKIFKEPKSKEQRLSLSIKVMDPSGKLLGKKIEEFHNGNKITYSDKKVVNYSGDDLNVCFLVTTPNENLIKGYYLIEIYEDHELKANSRLRLF